MTWTLIGNIRGPAGAAGAPGASGSGELSSPWIPQASSDLTWNDEFDSGSADLATRGWTVERWDTGATMTRAGDVSYHQGLTVTGTQYRSTIVGSQIHIQTPTNIGIFVYKTFASGQYMFGAKGTFPNLENGYFLRLYCYNATRNAAHPERSAFGAGSYANASGSGRTQFLATNASDTQLWNTDSGGGFPFGDSDRPFDTMVSDLRSVGKVEQGLWDSSRLSQRWRRTSTSSLGTDTVAAGMHIQTTGIAAIGTSDVNTVALDWIRRDGGTPL